MLVYHHRSKPKIMDLIKETHVRVQCCIPLHQPFNLLTLILVLEAIISMSQCKALRFNEHGLQWCVVFVQYIYQPVLVTEWHYVCMSLWTGSGKTFTWRIEITANVV